MRTVVFDFGNVIGWFDHQRAVSQLLRFTDKPAHELTLALYGSDIEERYERGEIGTAEYIRLAKRDAQLACTDDEFRAAFVDIFWRNAEVCELIPKLRPKYRLVLASNTNDAHYRAFTRQFADVLDHFDALCPSHHIGHRKPHPEYFTACQRVADAPPSECLFVDDLPSNVDAALRHGWKGLVYRLGIDLPAHMRELGVEV